MALVIPDQRADPPFISTVSPRESRINRYSVCVFIYIGCPKINPRFEFAATFCIKLLLGNCEKVQFDSFESLRLVKLEHNNVSSLLNDILKIMKV